MKEKLTEAVRLEKSVVDRIRLYVLDTRQTMGGFISAEMESIMDKLQPRKKQSSKQSKK